MRRIISALILLFTQIALANTPPPGQARTVLVDQATSAPISTTVVGADRALDVFSINPVTAPQMCSIVNGGVVVDPRQTRPLNIGTDSVVANQGGTWDIRNITGTVPLAPNACTESTLNSLNSKVVTTANGIKVDIGSVSVVTNPNSNTRDGAGVPITSTVAGPKTALDVNLINPLTTGATEATLSALNTKVVTTPNGIRVDGSSIVQPVSVTSLPLPTNAATESTVANLNSKIPTQGAKPSANSIPVVLATDQANLNVNLPAGIATEATLQSVDGKIRTFDLNSGAGTENVTGVNLRFSGPTGSTEAGTATNPFRVDPTGTTPQPITGSVTANIGSAGSVASEATLSQINTKTLSAGQKTMANSSPVVIANDQSPVPATQSGTWNVNNITGTVSLPTGAATDANLVTINTTLQDSLPRKLQDGNGVPITSKVSGASRALDVGVTVGGVHVDPRQIRPLTSGTDTVLAVQGGAWSVPNPANGGPNTTPPASANQVAGSDGTNLRVLKTTNDGTLKVDSSGSTAPLPSGAATEAKQDVGNTSLSAINGKLNSLGQKNMAGSVSVTLASDQPAIPISGSVTANNPTIGTNGAAAPSQSSQVGGSDGTNLRPIRVSSTGTVIVDGSASTQPVSAVSLPLPTGAATSALQTTGNTSLGNIDTKLTDGTQRSVVRGGTKGLTTPADITSTNVDANTQALDVAVKGSITANIGTTAGLATESTLSTLNSKVPANLTVTSNRLIVDGSSVTQPISATVLPLPTGAATAANQTTISSTLNNINSTLDVATSTRASESTLSAVNTKLTDGTQKSITRGGAKGTTTAGDVTSTNVDANTQALDVSIKGTAAISATSLPLPTGAATSALQTTGNTSLNTIATNTDVALSTRASQATVSSIDTKIPANLTVTANRLQVDGSGVTQPVSAATLPLPTGAATSALQTTGNTSLGNIDSDLDVALSTRASQATVASIDGKLNSLGQKVATGSVPVVIASDQSAVLTTNGNVIVNGTAAALNADAIPSTDVSAYANIYIQLTGTWTATLSFQGSNDNVNFVAVNAQPTNNGTSASITQITIPGIYKVPVNFRFFRLRMTAFTSGSAVASALITSNAANDLGQRSVSVNGTIGATQSGTWTVQPGNTANTTAWLVNSNTRDGAGNNITSAVAGANRPLDVIAVNPTGTRVDPTQIRALTATDVVTANQGGTWNVNNISGTVSLPTGAATSALQTTGNTSLGSVDTKLTNGTQRSQITDGTNNVAVSNATPVGTEQGLIVRNIPSGTQNVAITSSVLPTGAATEATLSNLNSKVTAVNTGAVTISTALPTGTNSIGQVTVNAGTNTSTAALNLETTQSAINTKLTDGTQKAIARGGAKGATVAADVTSTNIDTDTQALDVAVKASALPAGAATSALQTTANTALNSIDSKTPALVSGRQPVDGSGVTQPVSAVSLPLPTGAATETTLGSVNTKLPSGLTTKAASTAAVSADQALVVAISPNNTVNVAGTVTANLGTIAGVSTAANQTTGNTSLGNIDTKLTDGTQRARITDGTNNAAITNAAPVGTEQALVVRNVPSGTQTVSATSLPLPTGAATETTLAALNTKIPASPAQDRTTAASPNANRLSDGTTFYDARQVRALTASDVITANQQKVTSATLTSVTNSNASFTVIASNASRNGIVLHNDSNTTCFYAFSATATTSAFTIRLATQASYFMQAPIYSGVISGICSANNGSTRVTEL